MHDTTNRPFLSHQQPQQEVGAEEALVIYLCRATPVQKQKEIKIMFEAGKVLSAPHFSCMSRQIDTRTERRSCHGYRLSGGKGEEGWK
jgi:hypothetical protein